MNLKKYILFPLILVGIMFTGQAQAGAINQGKLWLEINLVNDNSIQIAGTGYIKIGEQDGLMTRDFKLPLRISIVNPDKTIYYAVHAANPQSSESEEDTLSTQREFFAWNQDGLYLAQESRYYYPESFSQRSQAEEYAHRLGLGNIEVEELQLLNSTVLVDDGYTKAYLETPLYFSNYQALKFNNQALSYTGSFIIKTLNRKLILNQYLFLEDYLVGVIQNEIGNSSPLEALKAQAVAARTHAVSLLLNNRHKADGYDLCNGTHCQVYKGEYLCNSLVIKAVKDTQGEVLLAAGRIADATYHSSCGGKTDSSAAIWKGKPIAHLEGVTCIPEVDSLDLSTELDARKWLDAKPDLAGMSSWERGALNWDKTITLAQLAKNAGLGSISRIEIIKRGRSGRILSLKLCGDTDILLDNEYKIRQAFGNLMSSFFYIRGDYKTDNGVVVIHPGRTINLIGKGAGHGVGMCQVGALRMARTGASYTDILQHYYPGTTITREWLNEL